MLTERTQLLSDQEKKLEEMETRQHIIKAINEEFNRTIAHRRAGTIFSGLILSSTINLLGLMPSAISPLLAQKGKKIPTENITLLILAGGIAISPIAILSIETGYKNFLNILDHPLKAISLGFLNRRTKHSNILPTLFFSTEITTQIYLLGELVAIALVNYYVDNDLIRKEQAIISIPNSLLFIAPISGAIAAFSINFSFLNDDYQKYLFQKALHKSAPLDHSMRLCQIKLLDALGEVIWQNIDLQILAEFYTNYHTVPLFTYFNNKIALSTTSESSFPHLFEFYWRNYHLEKLSRQLISTEDLEALLTEPQVKESTGRHLLQQSLNAIVIFSLIIAFSQADAAANDPDSLFFINTDLQWLRYLLGIWFAASNLRSNTVMNMYMSKEVIKQLYLIPQNWLRMSNLEKGTSGVGIILASMSTLIIMVINYQFPLIEKLDYEFAILTGLGAMPLIVKSTLSGLNNLAVNIAARIYGWYKRSDDMFNLFQNANPHPDKKNFPNNKQKLMASYLSRQIAALIQQQRQQIEKGATDITKRDFIWMRIHRLLRSNTEFPSLSYSKFYEFMENRASHRLYRENTLPDDFSDRPSPSLLIKTEKPSKGSPQEEIRKRLKEKKRGKEEIREPSSINLIVEKFGLYSKKNNKKITQSNLDMLSLALLFYLTEAVAGKTFAGQVFQWFLVVFALSIQTKQTLETIKNWEAPQAYGRSMSS